MSVIDWVDGVTPLDDANLSQLEQIGRKGVPSGYPPLDADGKIPPQYLPPSGGIVWLGEYAFATALSGDPGSGKAATNNADQTLATLLSISETTGGGIDVAAVLASLVAGERIYYQSKLDSSRYRLYDVTAVPTDAGAYRTIPVTFNKGAFANFANNDKLIVGIQRLAGAPGGGGGGGLDWEGAWGAGTAYVKGDVVTYNGVTYGAVNDSTGQTPPSAPASGLGALPVIPLVTALPASPFDGMEIILTDSLTAPTYTWRFRYVAAKASNKWVYLGGTSRWARVDTPETYFSTTYGDLATVGPQIVVPVAGLYEVLFAAAAAPQGTANSPGRAAIRFGSTAPNDADSIVMTTQPLYQVNRTVGKTGIVQGQVAAGDAIKMQYKGDGSNSVYYENRLIRVEPVAVGG